MSESDGGKGGGIGRRAKVPRPKHAERMARSERPVGVRAESVPVDPAHEKLQKISGIAAVTAVFRRDADRVVRLYYSDAMKAAAGPFCARMAELRRVYRLVPEEELVRVAGTVHHGGIVAAARVRPVPLFNGDAVDRWAAGGAPLVALDGVGNPHNLGAIARTLAFFGLPRLLIAGHHAQAGLSDAAYRVAEGGLEFLDVYQTSHLPQALRELRGRYRIVGATLQGGRPLSAMPADPRPICLVLGNEEEGLPESTLRVCEALVTIRGSGAVQSLNVSATAAILVAQIVASAAYRKRDPQPGQTVRSKRVRNSGRR